LIWLGFVVTLIQGVFPDCHALKLVDVDRWQHGCTVLVVAEGVREYISWASSWANPRSLDSPETANQFSGVFALALMVAVSFGWNLWTSRRVT
jgi:hypothetical protein